MKSICLLFAGLVLVLLAVMPMQAATIAYMDPQDLGNEIWPGNLAEDFTVNSPITITALGVYDSGGTGSTGSPAGTLTVGIVASNGTVEGSATFSPSTTYTLTGGDLFQNVTMFTLGPGTYSLTTTGWGVGIPNGNRNCSGGGCGTSNTSYTPPTLNTGGGLITFTGIGYSSTPGLTYLGPNDSWPDDEFNAGSFQFNASAAPEPATLAGVALGLIGLLAFRRYSFKG